MCRFGSPYRSRPVPGTFVFFGWYQKKIGTGKVPESASEKFSAEKSPGIGIEKSLGTGLRENMVPKNVPEPVSSDFWVSSSTHTSVYVLSLFSPSPG